MPGIVWNQTRFGSVWKLRAIFALALAVVLPAALLPRPDSAMRRLAGSLALLASAALVGSLAWAGHGQTGGPVEFHLSADVLHLLICGVWPGGLLPLVLLICLSKWADSQERFSQHKLVRRFSAIALVSVALLAISGLANAWCLVGSMHAMWSTIYGLVLLTKIGLFAAMVALGAANFLRVRRLQGAQATGRWLVRNVVIEIILAGAVLAAVGVMGLLPPPAEHLLHEHPASVAQTL